MFELLWFDVGYNTNIKSDNVQNVVNGEVIKDTKKKKCYEQTRTNFKKWKETKTIWDKYPFTFVYIFIMWNK